MPSLFLVMCARVRAALRPGALDRELDQELAAHLALAEADKVRRGMTREQARRAARVELGGLTQVREASREARGLPWLGTCWLDVKLGVRMLRKSWGLTLVGGLAMTVVIAIVAGVFSVFHTIFGSALPLDEGDRVVILTTWDSAASLRRGPALPDFERWRDTLRSVDDVGAFRTVERRLVTMEGTAASVSVAEMTASGFRLARVSPLLGRVLVEEDERDGAAPVVVISHEAWRTRFASDPTAVGQPVRLDGEVHTVVGVMPKEFAFPVNHGFWTPLRSEGSDQLPAPPEAAVFARLASGTSLEGAQAELATIGLLPSATVRETPERLAPRVVPYTLGLINVPELEQPWMRVLVLLVVTLLLVPPCANIAILVYARTVTRQEEFAARYALGASRGRLVGQLFVEALVLAAGAAGVALVLLQLAGGWVQGVQANGPPELGGAPFWIDFRPTWETVFFAAGLATFAAAVVGVVPAIRATGRLVQAGLRALGSRTGMRLGATWTALIVAQIAFSVAVLPTAMEQAWGWLRPGMLGPGFAPEEFLTARLALDEQGVEANQQQFGARFGDRQTELVRRLQAQPGVSAVTVAVALPGREPLLGVVEVEQLNGVDRLGGVAPTDGTPDRRFYVRASVNQVDDVFFDVFDVPLLTGRTFDTGDHEPTRATVVVNQTLARDLLGDNNPLGRRVRYVRTLGGEAPAVSEPGRWHEIVGVVADRPANTRRGTLYHPLAPGERHPVSLSLRVGPAADDVAGRLREVATALDPALRVDDVVPLENLYRQNELGATVFASVIAVVTLSILLLSAAGLYALMSFTVNQRRREIGIRSALGAQPRRLLAGIFRRALGQVSAGALAGLMVALLIGYYLPFEELGFGVNIPGVIPAAAAFMMMVGLLATAGPARRGLRVEPTEALRDG
jgi:predicted permease